MRCLSKASDCKPWLTNRAKLATIRAKSDLSLSETPCTRCSAVRVTIFLTIKPKTMAQRLAMSLLHDAVYSADPDIRAEARSEIIDRTDGKAVQAIEHSGSIARTHEEELLALDNSESDDATGKEVRSPV